MAVRERMIERDDVRVHVVQSEPSEPAGTPLLLIPGMAETADEYGDFLARLAPRPAAAVTMRGRGRSHQPPDGYGTHDHAEDVAVAADGLGFDRFVLFPFSRGTTYALGFADRWPERVAGLVVGDYPAEQRALPDDFAEWYIKGSWRGRPVSDRTTKGALAAIQRDSAVDVPMWSVVAELRCPILLLRGRQEHGYVIVGDEELEDYRSHARDLTMRELQNSGHDLWEPDPGPLIDALSPWLDRVDRASV